MAELHIFDPEGDVLLILDRCLKEDDLVESVDEEERESVPEGGFVSEQRGPWVEDEAPPLSADVPGWPEPEPESVPYEPQAEIPKAEVDGMTKLESSASAFLASQETKPRVEKVQMRASSKHLILASPTFRTSLGSGTYPEGRILQIEGTLAVPLPDEDPDVMIILLNIIHGLSSKVPRQVDLNMLSRLAVTVNHRHMHEAVELWSDTWIENLKRDEGLPGSYTPEILLSWLFIFWVFRKDKDFRNMSQILERECDHSLESEVETVYVGPYIPASIISEFAIWTPDRRDLLTTCQALFRKSV
jgi:hypothetical protein